jgi:hypothetical protein
MAVARSVLEARIAGIVLDDATDVVARIVPEIQAAQKDLEERAYKFIIQEAAIYPDPKVNAGYTSVLATGGGAPASAAPDDWLGPRGDPFRLIGGTGDDALDLRLPPLQWVEADSELYKIHRSDASYVDARGEPKFLTWDTATSDNVSGVVINCAPVADILYNFHITYWKRLDTLTGTGDSNWWTENLQDYLVFRAAARTLAFNRDHTEAARYELMAEAAFRRAKSHDKRRRLRRQGGRIRLRRDVGGTFQQRRM